MSSEDLIEKLKDVFDSVLPQTSVMNYPKEAMKIGTYVRSSRLNKLAIITDAFYGELDEDNNKIIIYTLLVLPEKSKLGKNYDNPGKYYLVNEYEYDVIGYLMIKPINVKEIARMVNGGLF